MKEGLRQITNLMLTDRNAPQNEKTHLRTSTPQIHELLTLNLQTIDFGECLPASVHERKLSITLKQNCLQPKVISISVVCDDQHLTDLPEYIFGIRKENSYEYYDEFKFKAIQRGTYNFVVGVKTPTLTDYNISARLMVAIDGVEGVLTLQLKQVAKMPFVCCNKEMVSQDGFRLIKLALIKNKSRRETKIVFRCSQNLNLTFLAEVVGPEYYSGNEVDIKPRNLLVGNKGAFMLNIITCCPQQLDKHWICIRKVLILRIKDTSIHFHFPIQVTFYPEGRRGDNSNVE